MTNNYTPLDIKKIKNSHQVLPFKEAEPTKKERITFQEKTEFEVEKEVAPLISVRQESIRLPPDLKKIGAQSVPSIKTATYQTINLPLSDEKIISGLHAPVTSSLRWLATLAIYLLKIAHLQLKVIHGKVVRVFKS